MALNKENLYSPEPNKELSLSRQLLTGGTSGSSVSSASSSGVAAMSPKLSFKTSRERSSASLLSLTGSHLARTPKIARRSTGSSKQVGSSNSPPMVKIKCQRLNADSKEYEEVEVEVPAPVYGTLRFYNEADRLRQKQREEGYVPEDDPNAKNGKKSLTSKIRNLFAAKS